MDFYATAAQVIPVLLLALAWESGYLSRLKTEDRSSGFRWTKPRVRAWGVFTIGISLVAEAVMVLVLGDTIGGGGITKGLGLLAIGALLATFGARLITDLLDATSS